MKVSIIGGGGLVGSCTGFALQAGGIVREIVLIDANAELAAGQALDLLHGSSLMADQIDPLGRVRRDTRRAIVSASPPVCVENRMKAGSI